MFEYLLLSLNLIPFLRIGFLTHADKPVRQSDSTTITWCHSVCSFSLSYLWMFQMFITYLFEYIVIRDENFLNKFRNSSANLRASQYSKLKLLLTSHCSWSHLVYGVLKLVEFIWHHNLRSYLGLRLPSPSLWKISTAKRVLSQKHILQGIRLT